MGEIFLLKLLIGHHQLISREMTLYLEVDKSKVKIILKFKFSVTIQSFIVETDLSIYMFFWFFLEGWGVGGGRVSDL